MKRENSKIVTLRLDYERDADLIAWLEGHDRGCRSQGIRDMLRVGLGLTKQHQLLTDLDKLRQVVAAELRKTLSGIEFLQSTPTASNALRTEAESKYGEKLDRLLNLL